MNIYLFQAKTKTIWLFTCIAFSLLSKLDIMATPYPEKTNGILRVPPQLDVIT